MSTSGGLHEDLEVFRVRNYVDSFERLRPNRHSARREARNKISKKDLNAGAEAGALPSWPDLRAQGQAFLREFPDDSFMPTVLEGALHVGQSNNPIRGNLCALALREITGHLLHTLAPDLRVSNCCSRDADFSQQLHERLELAERDKQSAVELAKLQLTTDLQKTAAAKDAQIQELKARLEGSGVAQKLAVSEALSAAEKERDRLANALAESEREKKAASELADALFASEQHKITAAKEKEIHELKAKLKAVELEKKLAVTEAVSVIEKERDELKNGIKQVQLEKQLSEQSLKDKYETQIKDRDDAIERLKDMKARLSTKMVGETLEQHCETEFNRVRSMAFPRAYFEKDNDARTGSKGDYIFRDADRPAPRSSRSCSR